MTEHGGGDKGRSGLPGNRELIGGLGALQVEINQGPVKMIFVDCGLSKHADRLIGIPIHLFSCWEWGCL